MFIKVNVNTISLMSKILCNFVEIGGRADIPNMGSRYCKDPWWVDAKKIFEAMGGGRCFFLEDLFDEESYNPGYSAVQDIACVTSVRAKLVAVHTDVMDVANPIKPIKL